MLDQNRPFALTPIAKDYLWGGTRLDDDFQLNLGVRPLAEAWVCSTHPDGQSKADGILLGELGVTSSAFDKWKTRTAYSD